MLYPILLDLHGKAVLVVGGGNVAERKVHSLLDCGASVTLVAPELTRALMQLGNEGTLSVRVRAFEDGDIAGMALVVSAVNDRVVSSRVVQVCKAAGVIVNVVDKPDLCDFIVPAVVRRGRMTIAVSTGGASPALARRIKERLASEFGEAYGRLLEAAARIRQRGLDGMTDPDQRRRALEQLAGDEFLELAEDMDVGQLEAEIASRIGLERP